MRILEFYQKDQKSPESIQRFEINTSIITCWITRRMFPVLINIIKKKYINKYYTNNIIPVGLLEGCKLILLRFEINIIPAGLVEGCFPY